MRAAWTWLGLAIAVAIATAGAASGAHAHAALVAAEPADRATVSVPPSALTLTFNEPVAPIVLRLVGPGGRIDDLSDYAAENMTVRIKPPHGMANGTYLLSWRVTSADGHPVGGSILFSIGAPSEIAPADVSGSERSVQVGVWITKIALYLGLFIGIGGVAYGAWISRTAGAGYHPAIVAGLALGFVAAPLSILMQGLDALALSPGAFRFRVAWQTGIATTYGLTAGLSILGFGASIAAAQVKSPANKMLSLVGVAMAGAALAASGHASTALPWITRPAVFIHAVTVALWIGALLPLAAAMRRPERVVELVRFSRSIVAVVALLVVTGVILAVIQLESLEALWRTDYGLILCGKIALVIVLITIAGANRFVLTPRIARGDERAVRNLARTIAAEVTVVIVIFGLVAGWRFTPPPRTLAIPEEIFAHFHVPAAMADIRIHPHPGGRWSAVVKLSNEQNEPLAAKDLTLILSNPDANIEALRWPATRIDDAWRTDDMRIPLGGRWRLRLDILISDFEKITMEDAIELPR
jgi:copper transport protein